MFSKFLLPGLSLTMLAAAIVYVQRDPHSEATAPPPIAPSRSPFETTVAAIGVVEAQTENIEIGSPVAGVVAEVFVEAGQRVAAGQALLRLDDRHLQLRAQHRRPLTSFLVQGPVVVDVLQLGIVSRLLRLLRRQMLLHEVDDALRSAEVGFVPLEDHRQLQRAVRDLGASG